MAGPYGDTPMDAYLRTAQGFQALRAKQIELQQQEALRRASIIDALAGMDQGQQQTPAPGEPSQPMQQPGSAAPGATFMPVNKGAPPLGATGGPPAPPGAGGVSQPPPGGGAQPGIPGAPGSFSLGKLLARMRADPRNQGVDDATLLGLASKVQQVLAPEDRILLQYMLGQQRLQTQERGQDLRMEQVQQQIQSALERANISADVRLQIANLMGQYGLQRVDRQQQGAMDRTQFNANVRREIESGKLDLAHLKEENLQAYRDRVNELKQQGLNQRVAEMQAKIDIAAAVDETRRRGQDFGLQRTQLMGDIRNKIADKQIAAMMERTRMLLQQGQNMPDDTKEMIAESLYAGDPSLLHSVLGYSRNRVGVVDEILKKVKELHPDVTGQQLAGLRAQFGGVMQAGRTIGGTLGRVELGAQELPLTADLVESVARVNRSRFPTVNAVRNAVQRGVTGPDAEAVVQLNIYIETLKAAYEQIRARGQVTNKVREIGDRLVNGNMPVEQLAAAADAFRQEAGVVQKAAPAALKAVAGQGGSVSRETSGGAPADVIRYDAQGNRIEQ